VRHAASLDIAARSSERHRGLSRSIICPPGRPVPAPSRDRPAVFHVKPGDPPRHAGGRGGSRAVARRRAAAAGQPGSRPQQGSGGRQTGSRPSRQGRGAAAGHAAAGAAGSRPSRTLLRAGGEATANTSPSIGCRARSRARMARPKRRTRWAARRRLVFHVKRRRRVTRAIRPSSGHRSIALHIAGLPAPPDRDEWPLPLSEGRRYTRLDRPAGSLAAQRVPGGRPYAISPRIDRR
jgi:hypothetical protein